MCWAARSQGIGFAALLGLVYAILYSLLQAEELALLLGALLLFTTLALDHAADPQARLVSGDGLQRPHHLMGKLPSSATDDTDHQP